MDKVAKINSFVEVHPMIYAYTTPGISYHDGWIKIGYTEMQTVEERIRQQTHTADVRWELEWSSDAKYSNGSGKYFKDGDFHRYLEVEREVPRYKRTEWFKLDSETSLYYFDVFAKGEISVSDEKCEYNLRNEQKEAVRMTKAYFENGGKDFLWNAKPRFGKTLTSYDLVRQMGFKKVLVVTNRPAIANSWADDFYKFIGWRKELCFVSDNDALKEKKGILTHDEYVNSDDVGEKGMVAFESLQSLKGSVYFGGKFQKLEWMTSEYRDGSGKLQKGIEFDLLIVDESHEGVDTMLSERAFDNINRKHTLYLSGTPFKAIAKGKFSSEQIFNWSYSDEQEAKRTWAGEEYNPYESLPQLNLYTYQLSNMIREKLKKGKFVEGVGTVNYAFDLNEFFATDPSSGKFIYEDSVRKFLIALGTQEKYPFSSPEAREELSHTLWLLNRVQSAKALAKLLVDDPVFGGGAYKVVLAAGDGKSGLDDEEIEKKAFARVTKAIAKYPKTITISVGQLTVGVTVPQWSGVLMLCNMKSPSSYMQAVFRAQNPCTIDKDGKRFAKQNAYVFDFDPARTLTIYDEFANNLFPGASNGFGTSQERQDKIKKLQNFFPVIGEDHEGKMVELDAAQVLSIPRKLKSEEVVKRGFMSNFLFQNIENVFNSPGIEKIMEKLSPAQEETKRREAGSLSDISNVELDDDGNVIIPDEIVIGTEQKVFGDKYYTEVKRDFNTQISNFSKSGNNSDPNNQNLMNSFDEVVEVVKNTVKQKIIEPVADEHGAKISTKKQIVSQTEQEIAHNFDKIKGDYEQKVKIAEVERDKKLKHATTQEQVNEANSIYGKAVEDAQTELKQTVVEVAKKTIEDKPQEVVREMVQSRAEEEKKSAEDAVRDRLRGFSRTIPSFIMAYGDETLTLKDFDNRIEPEVFEDVTGITVEQFRLLRDGGNVKDPETGEESYFKGNLFDEVVFNDSVKEFWHKKEELADYFNEERDEDIFDYIPPQKTNQIFTPKWVVKKMVDALEENNPGCFDDPRKKFADLYMKSGLYITEIVKRLFRSKGMKQIFPDEKERLRHIMREQVYGMAPTRIIYLIATNYILGFDEQLKAETKNFVQEDAAQAAKEDRLAELIDKCFGEKQGV